jgi:hypothetical protein
MTTVLKPFMAKANEMAALVVVFPTPPLPEVMTTVVARGFGLVCLESLLTVFSP